MEAPNFQTYSTKSEKNDKSKRNFGWNVEDDNGPKRGHPLCLWKPHADRGNLASLVNYQNCQKEETGKRFDAVRK